MFKFGRWEMCTSVEEKKCTLIVDCLPYDMIEKYILWSVDFQTLNRIKVKW